MDNQSVRFDEQPADAPSSRGHQDLSRRRRRPADWRSGGSRVQRWDVDVLTACAIGAGLGMLTAPAASLFATDIDAPWSLIGLWIGLMAAISFALVRARPAGLFGWKPRDVLLGVGVAVVVRLLGGLIGNVQVTPFPALPDSSAGLAAATLELAVPSLIGPVVEELFFRAVIFVTLYQLLRRIVGRLTAAVVGALLSAIAFTALHVAYSPAPMAEMLQLLTLGIAAAFLVITTGRIWSAVVMHIAYNLLYIILAIIGTLLS